MESRRERTQGRSRRRGVLCAVAVALCLLPGLAAFAQDTSGSTASEAPAPPTPGLSELPALMAPPVPAQPPPPDAAAEPAEPAPTATDASPADASAADDIADIFSKVGDQLYEDCIFDLSEEQVQVRTALIQAYVQQGATSAAARRLAAIQIQTPKLSPKCEAVRHSPEQAAPEPAPPEPAQQQAEATPEPPPTGWSTTTTEPAPVPPKPQVANVPKPPKPASNEPPAVISLVGKKVPEQWDCAEGVDYVTIHLNGYERKLTGGEICNPFEDVVHELSASLSGFRLGYVIKTGRLFVIAGGSAEDGKTITWGLSGRDVCRNNPDPDCFATKTVGPLPPGEYTFAEGKQYRVSWGPRTKRHVAAVYLRKLWNKERFSPQHVAAILKRGNIAIHLRLKGEMSEACIGLEPKGWAYVASLIKDGRATGLNVYIDEPYPQIAEAPPVVVASSFSLTSLFK
jgi:cell division septation protein DedD